MPAENQSDVGYANVPQALGHPTISGTPREGQTLTATSPAYNNPFTDLGRQWTRGQVPIPGATNATYVLTSADVGRQIGYYEQPSNASGKAPRRYLALRTDRVERVGGDPTPAFPSHDLRLGYFGPFDGLQGTLGPLPVIVGAVLTLLGDTLTLNGEPLTLGV